MKTTILLVSVFVFYSACLHAQIEKGRVQIGGSIGVVHQKSNDIPQVSPDIKYTDVFISPSLGKFYKKNKMIGAFLTFDYYETLYNNQNINRTYGGGVFLRQYQPVIRSLYILFDERAAFSYQYGNTYYYTQGGGTLNSKTYGYNINASVEAGMAYDIAKRMQLELLLNNLLYAGFGDYNTGTNYSLHSSLETNPFSNIQIGFRFYLK